MKVLLYNTSLYESLYYFAGPGEANDIRIAIFIEIILHYGKIGIYCNGKGNVCGFYWECKKCHKLKRVIQWKKHSSLQNILCHLKIDELYVDYDEVYESTSEPANIGIYLTKLKLDCCFRYYFDKNSVINISMKEIYQNYNITPAMKKELIAKTIDYKTGTYVCEICKKIFMLLEDNNYTMAKHHVNHVIDDMNIKYLTCRGDSASEEE